MKQENPKIPDWAREERQKDFEWIGENLHLFLPTAKDAFKEHGRGAIVVDTTSQPTGEGHPYGYFSQGILDEQSDEDIKRMVREYNPDEELVLVLIKSQDRTSTYRIKSL